MSDDLLQTHGKTSEATSRMMSPLDSPVLDPDQLKRIENTHRGFLYQHLFAVGSLFLAQEGGVAKITVERDEDLEIVLPDEHVYVQVKTRSSSIQRHDIQSTLDQFDQIRAAHRSHSRSGRPLLCIVSNVAPGPDLLRQCRDHDWPSDVRIFWPSSGKPQPPWIPPAWPTLLDAIAWCEQKANSIPFCAVAGSILVWKLAALVQYACTGALNHTFIAQDLPDLFEQVIVQLQTFPETPITYVAHTQEPPYSSVAHVRLIVGHSGSGKTAWASTASLHEEIDAAYFDAGDTPSTALPATLTRELVARLFPRSGLYRSQILLPGYSGLDSLRAVDAVLRAKNKHVAVFLDNAHRVPATDISALVSATINIRWILLAQSCPNQVAMESLLSVSSEHLSGWSPESIAARSRSEGCSIDYLVAEKVRAVTRGLPLFVRSTLALAKNSYAGDVATCCAELAQASHSAITSQEVILANIRMSLSDLSRKCMAILSISEVPLSPKEVNKIIAQSLGVTDVTVAQSLRELGSWGVIQFWRAGQIVLHDAFRILAAEELNRLPSEVVLSARRATKDCLVAEPDPLRLVFLIRLLPTIGDTETLVDIATSASERFKELGLIPEISAILRKYVEESSSSVRDRFWAVDSLALWASEPGDLTTFERLTHEMESLYESGKLGAKERAELATKRMLLCGRKGDSEGALMELKAAEESVKGEPEHRRVLVYDCGVALFHAGKYVDAARFAEEVGEEYFDTLGLKGEDVAFKNPPEIWTALKEDESKLDDLKRLADCLDLYAMSRDKLGIRSGLARIHAHKFYVMAGAYRSAVRVGQDFVDELLQIGGGPHEARRFIEQSLLPLVRDLRLLEYVVPVRSQYAVILAYCGEIKAARHEMRALLEFKVQDPAMQAELHRQAEGIEKIADGYNPYLREPTAKSQRLMKQFVDRGTTQVRKIGRNSSCPCGSGKKFKRCCMRR